MMNHIIKLLLLMILLGCEEPTPPEDGMDFSLKHVTLGISFPPVSDEEQRDFSKPLLAELNVRHIRISEEWAFREPTEGVFNWAPLDDRINWAFENNIKVLLTIQSNGPEWACDTLYNDNSCLYTNNEKFKNYIEQLLQRYSGKIAKIQFGNEWQSEFWYVGTARQFTEVNNILYHAARTYSPGTRVVLGGFTAISLRFLAGCDGDVDRFRDDEGRFYDKKYFSDNCNSLEFQNIFTRIEYVLTNALYDELDIHLYDDVENWDEYYRHFKSMTSKPVIVSEFGGPNMNYEPYSEDYQADRLYKYIRKLDSLQITEAYYFKLVEGTDNPAHEKSGLIRKADLSRKKSFEIFKRFNE